MPPENPADPSKLLIGFESGFLSLWDLGTKKQEEHYKCPKGKLTSVCWHFEGKQFVCSLSDGSLVTYNIRGGQGKWAKQVQIVFLKVSQFFCSAAITRHLPGVAPQKQGGPR